MIFCTNCGALLMPKKTKNGTLEPLVCKKCGTTHKEKIKEGDYRTQKQFLRSGSDLTAIFDQTKANSSRVPLTNILCPNCNHNEAYYIETQKNISDEFEMVVLYRCKKCKQTWVGN